MINILKSYCEKYNLSWRFVKFLFVGVLNTVFGYSVFALCTFIGLHYTLSTLIATVLGILFNFKTTGVIVFKNNDNMLLFKFLIVYGITYLFTVIGLKIFLIFNLNNFYLNYFLLLPINVIISYVLMRNFVFKK